MKKIPFLPGLFFCLFMTIVINSFVGATNVSTTGDQISFVLTPQEGTIGTEITITGSGFGTKKSKVLIGGMATKIAKDGWKPDSITCTLTKIPSVGTHNVTIKTYKADDIILSNAFTVKPPEIDFLAYQGVAGDPITLTGNFFGTKKGKVYIENPDTGKMKNCKIISWSMDIIDFTVPKMSNSFPVGSYRLKVDNKIGMATSENFTINIDPCGGLDVPCESVIMGPYLVWSRFNDPVTTTVASDETGEVLTLEWIQAGDVVDLFVTLPGEQRIAYQQYAKMPSLEQGNMVAAVILGLNSHLPGEQRIAYQQYAKMPSLEQGNTEVGVIISAPFNKAGCDVIDIWPLVGSCGDKGNCCDLHDYCINEKCTGKYGALDSGNLLDCIIPLSCSFECTQCHHDVIACYLRPLPPGPSACCDRGDCGKDQQCLPGLYVETDSCVCVQLQLQPVDPCYHGDPTFIQLSRRIKSQPKTFTSNSRSKELVAKITVPYEDSLVRANVPIFGLAHGVNFKEYHVEYGEGKEPSEWITVVKSATPQANDEGSSEMCGSNDLTIHGNLATWDTGLKTYVYLPSYPKEHPINLKGTYTVRLVVTGKDGSEAEDRVTVEVADAIPNALGGKVVSNDQKVILSVPEQALLDDFRLISIKQMDRPPDMTSSVRHIVGKVYEFREADERFTKPVKLQMAFAPEDIGSNNPNRFGIYAYDAQKKEWVYLNSLRVENENKITTDIQKLYTYYALMASNRAGEGSIVKHDSKGKEVRKVATVKGTGKFLLNNSFEDSMGEWSNRDGEVGAEVSLAEEATDDGRKTLKITNKHVGGNFAVNAVKTPFDAKDYPLVQFDYHIPSDVKTNFLVKVSGRWYDIGFTDDPKELRDMRVNIAHIGDIENVIADNKWHTAKFNLYDMLRTKTGNTVVDEMIMADWDVGGYMKLQFGHNAKGAAYYIDNFSISREASTTKVSGNVIEVDNFNQKQKTNALGGAAFIFNSSDGGTLAVDFSGEDAHWSGHSLNLHYNVSKPGSYAGYVSLLNNVDLRSYQTLSLFVKTLEDGQDFLVGLKDRSGHEQKVSINQYLPKNIATTSWQHATIPLVVFTGIQDWSGVENLSFSFENNLHKKGTVVVDQIEFRKELKWLRVDNFEKFNGKNLLGGNQMTFVSGAAAINGQYAKGSPNGIYRLSYGGNIGTINAYASELKSYAGWATELRGIDCSQCGALSFRVRGAEGGENAVIYLDDGNFRWGVELAKYTRPSTLWQTVEIPLQEFAEYGVDLTHLAELKFTFEGAKMSGTIYLDDIQFGVAEEIQ
jgi:hypothetical protein